MLVLWFASWTSDLKVGGSRPSPCQCVDKKLYPTSSLSPPRCINGYRQHTAEGSPVMD